jgi:hypothetical protein
MLSAKSDPCWSPPKKNATGTFERVGNLRQTSCRRAVDALFVFLDLLEGNAQPIATVARQFRAIEWTVNAAFLPQERVRRSLVADGAHGPGGAVWLSVVRSGGILRPLRCLTPKRTGLTACGRFQPVQGK